MMKSFFKKLAFVMALAMVVSLAAPAAAKAVAANEVKIAYQNGSAISEVNLAKVGDTEDLKFTGAPDYKEAGFEWISSNPAVATVDKAGVVTAVAAGTANVTIKIGTDREATVAVNVVNLPTYTATMGTSRDNLLTEATLDLEDNKVIDLAFFGIKDYDAKRYNCNWYSVDENVATVDNKGLVTAVAEGKTVISLGVYNVVTGKKHAVASCTVTVKGKEVVATATPTPTPVVDKDAFEVIQKDTDKFVLTFEGEKTVEEIKENLTISVKIGDKDYPISFENVTVDGKQVTVTTYALFENGEVYTLTYNDQVAEYAILLGEIQGVGVKYYTGKDKTNTVAYVAEEEHEDYVTLVPVLYDLYGNDITAKYDLNNFDFTYEVSENVKAVRIYNDVFAFDKAGVATVDITASWITDAGEFLTVSGKASFVVEKRPAIVLTLEKVGIADIDTTDDADGQTFYVDDLYTYIANPVESFQYDPNSAVWNTNPGTTLTYYEDAEPDYYYTAVFKDNRGNVTTSNAVYQFGTFHYESTNNEVLNISDNGEVDILKAGKANILVYFTPADGTTAKKLIASTPVIVNPEPYPVRYEIVNDSQTTASHVVDGDLNDVTFKIKVYDQNGNQYTHKNGLLNLIDFIKVEARDTRYADIPAYLKDNDKINVGISWDRYITVKFDADKYQDDLGTNNSKQYSYKVSFDETDITKTLKTAYDVLSLTVKNTYEEYDILNNFITAAKTETTYELPSNYKFNVSFGGNITVDVAVKNVIGYKNQLAQNKEKFSISGSDKTVFDVKYLSSGNLAIAKVPEELLEDITGQNRTTGEIGKVYYKWSAPSKTVIAGQSDNNEAYVPAVEGPGYVGFKFNKIVETASGSAFRYAGNGTYSISFATTRTDGGNIYTVKTSTVTVSNSQNQVKYLGLNPDFEGVTELDIPVITKSLDEYTPEEYEDIYKDILDIIKEQLMFSYDEIFLGKYFEDTYYERDYDYWTSGKVVFNLDASKITPSKDGKSIVISTVAFDVTLDNGDGATYPYTSVVSVGARIKEK